ncbi:protein-associating with the carboxyl-terminal domain of ezrin [Anabrus simplex]|uniref:protein-associating with the carboxyl-terminal domain of ezrin n=1 Tax=Anabrus simplex TaxID=316456 RepID=UPI0034DDB4EF
MGNEGSQLVGLEIDDESIEVTENWVHHSASVSTGNTSQISVFICPVFSGTSKGGPPPLIQAAKNLMLHRHPCILKYISSWSKSGRYHLATEEVKPLAHVLDHQTTLQIALGLHSILKALIFLHEKALSSHNNICRAAVYVTPDGTWKLGGFEYLCRFTELTPSHLQQTRAHRYEKAVPPEEDSVKTASSIVQPTAVDQFAFGVLVEEVLGRNTDEDLPFLTEFRDLAKKQLQSPEPSLRPQLAPLLQHAFFSHDFIKVYSFLVEIPLKTESEKQAFFRSLPSQLLSFPEELVATQLGSLLLARVVLLDGTAQEHLLPQLLCARNDNSGTCLFTLATYKQHVVPKLLQMFCVRDAQIRLLLLSHFRSFYTAFSKEQLKSCILPELLVGIKDTSDQLVSVTLRALADLVLVLGAATVIGGKRGKLFTDGRPKVHGNQVFALKSQSPIQSKQSSPETVAPLHGPDADSISYEVDLPERPSPDGGEDHTATSDEETEAWSDWDVAENNSNEESPVNIEMPSPSSEPQQSQTNSTTTTPTSGTAPQHLPDISSLDIKNISNSSINKDEFDFFQDMEPVISKPPILHIEDQNPNITSPTKRKNIFEVNSLTSDSWEETEGEAWGDDLVEWGLDNEPDLTESENP